jgi:hypothetical protein
MVSWNILQTGSRLMRIFALKTMFALNIITILTLVRFKKLICLSSFQCLCFRSHILPITNFIRSRNWNMEVA